MKEQLDLALGKLSEILGRQDTHVAKLDEWWSGWEWTMKEYIIVKCIEELYTRIERVDKALDKIIKKEKK